MSLFQKTIINKYLKLQNQDQLNQKWDLFCAHFHNTEIQENIRNSKEEQYQGEFLIDLFVDVLGYTKNPTPHFNLTTEYKNVKDSKKADGAIIINDKVLAIIELKGTDTTDLGKVETQAFGYKNNQPDCKYVITSNFEKLRFYIDNAIEHLEFNLFELTKSDFELLYLCLAVENISADIPARIKNESVGKEDEITKKLYKDYSVFKRELFKNLSEQNPEFDPLELFKKSQKLLDRLLFLFFGEDRGLLPPNSVRLILEQWNKLKDLDEYVPLYDRFKKYFGYLNTGFKGKDFSVFAYNGGLFKPDEVLDMITIDDDLLYQHSLKLSEYDFASEVDVNILGHIFENSLNEIDEIKAQIEGQEIDKSKTKRKKDGVFYTPKYITKYIVENTVGKLCEEKKTELGIAEEDYSTDKKRQQKTKLALLQKLEDYRTWLHQITIIDPACGSGAFLNEALNFLIDEHKYIDELEAKLTGSSIAFTYHSESILENNLFGVDLNEESVEIAKLSLWLRTAEPNRKLNDLSNNIKCGNSLIDDAEIAGDKAFNWDKEFPQIFAKGGFDVVIGNPPYVRVQNIDKLSVKYFEKKYQSAIGKFDIYVLFNELSCERLIKERGIICFIQPHRFISADFGKGLRNYFNKNRFLQKIISFTDIDIFESANTYTGIFFLQKKKNEVLYYYEFQNINKNLVEEKLSQIETFEIISYDSLAENWSLKSNVISNLLNKLKNNNLLNYFSKNISQGVIPGNDKIYYFEILEENNSFYIIKNLFDEIEEIEKGLVRKVIKGNNISRYLLPKNDYFIIYPYKIVNGKQNIINEDDFSINYPKTYNYLSKYKDFLIELRIKYKTNIDWFGFHRPREMRFLESKKIITTHASIKPNFTFSENEFFNQNVYGIEINEDQNVKYFLCLLNSNITNFVIKNISSMINGGYYLYKSDYLNQIPIKITENQQPFIEKADQMLSLNKELQELSAKFQRNLQREFSLETLSKKLQNWYELSFAEFLKELAKAKLNLTLSQKAEWEDYFLAEQQKAISIKSQIDQTDKEIDQMVYELYGLTEEEIEIVENS